MRQMDSEPGLLEPIWAYAASVVENAHEPESGSKEKLLP